MVDSNEQKWSHKELKDRINRLKNVEKELQKMSPPRDVFGADVDSIKAKLKSVPQVEEVEKELTDLRQRVIKYRVSLKDNKDKAKAEYEAEYEAKTALDIAEYKVEQAKIKGKEVSEAEALLVQGREVLARKDYQLVHELAAKAIKTTHHKNKEMAKPHVTVNLDVQDYSTGVWKAVDLGIVNRGNADAQSVELKFSPEVEVKLLARLPRLEAGAMEIIQIGLKPKETGDIPVDIELNYNDIDGNTYTDVQRFWLKVSGHLEMAPTIVDADLGTVLPPQLENYTLMRKIGSGGFADVYLGQGSDESIVAVKIPRLSQYETVEAKDFLSEADLWTKLSRMKIPYIVELYEYGTAPYPWIAMEHMEGGSLRDHMASLERKGCVEIAIKLMEALHSAHHHGVIHRDIKPENVLFDSQNTPKLTDWGLGKVLLDASRNSVGFRGTLAYSAPEQLASSKFGSIDWRTDIYQMGMMVYELLTRELPFSGEEAGIAVSRILNDNPPLPSQVNSEIPAELDDAVLRAIAKRKEDRFQSMDAFKDRLEQVLKVL